MSLSITKTYATGAPLTKAELDAAFADIETKFNTTLIAGSEIQASAIATSNIADSAVTTAKINDLACTTAKINDLAVTAGKLAADAVTTVKILDANVTTAKIADSNITAAKLASGAALSNLGSSPNFSGDTVQENGKNVIVSNTNAATKSLSIIRGVVNLDGTSGTGEGFSSSRSATGTYSITYTTSMGDTPVIVASTNNGSPIICTATAGSGTASVNTYNTSGVATNSQFHFIIIGQRA